MEADDAVARTIASFRTCSTLRTPSCCGKRRAPSHSFDSDWV